MLDAVPSPYLVPYEGGFRVTDASTRPPPDAPGEDECEDRLDALVDRLDDLQRMLYADDRFALLLIFQAMDAAGKDGTIRKVLTGVNPAGCQVHSFKRPSSEELDHDFLWRCARRLPERGRIGVFNRSYYEEVLVVRVHPAFLESQRLPEGAREPREAGSTEPGGPPADVPGGADPGGGSGFWRRRFESIADHEKHLARSGTVILKFWLNVSRREQRRRFLARLEEPDKNWKFSLRDVEESRHWEDYMTAYQEALAATSRPWAPWYAVPADDKDYMRMVTADILVRTLETLPLRYPEPKEALRARFEEMRSLLGGSRA